MPWHTNPQLLQFLNKLSLNYAAAYGLVEDLGLEGTKYSWVAAIFNFGYLAGSIPSNYLLQKVPAAKMLGAALLTWAVLLISHVGVKNYAGMLVVRFLLGLLEACISPGVMVCAKLFYKKDQQPFRLFTILSMNGFSTMLGALLGFGLGHAKPLHVGAIHATWPTIFLTFGLINLAWGVVFLVFCPDTPASAKFLDSREKAILIKEIAQNNQGLNDRTYKWYQIKESLLDVPVWLLAFIGLGCGIINGLVSNFLSALLKGFSNFDPIKVTALQLPTGAIEFVVVFGFGLLSLYRKNVAVFSFVCTSLIPLAGLIGLKTIPDGHTWGMIGCTWLQFIIGAQVVISWILINLNHSCGSTKRSMVTGIWFTFYSSGNIIGPFLVFSKEAPRYPSLLEGLITCYCGMIVLAVVYVFMMWRRNKERNAEQGELTEEMAREAILNGFKDMTDTENRFFRYSY